MAKAAAINMRGIEAFDTYGAWLLVCGTLIGLTAATGPWVSAGLGVFFALTGSLLDLEYWGWRDTPRHR